MSGQQEIQDVSSRTGRAGVKLLVYGDPGIGKTRLVGTSPNCLILRPPNDNTDSIRGGSAKEWVIRDWDEMWQAFEFVRHGGGPAWKPSLKSWLWLDSISLWQDVGLDDIWGTVIAEKPHRARYGLDKAEYGINMHRLSQWVRHMVGMAEDGHFNFGITAHPLDLPVTDVEDADEKQMPYVQGKNMATKVCGYMNVVAYYGLTKKGTRCLYTQASDKFYAKDQFDAFGEKGIVLNPTMLKIIKQIAEARKPATAPKATRSKRRTNTTRKGR